MRPPVFAHGSLRLYLLSLLAESPQHGYEMIQSLSDRFGGTYSPSAGTIYPRLAKLEEEGLVTRSEEIRKSVYTITPAGRAELAARKGELAQIENAVTDSVRRLADEVRSGVTAALRSLKADLASAARDARTEPSPVTSEKEEEDGPDPRIAARSAVRDAEAIVTEFRHNLRADIRSHVAHGGSLTPSQVESLREQLARVRADVVGKISQ